MCLRCIIKKSKLVELYGYGMILFWYVNIYTKEKSLKKYSPKY